MWLETRTCQYSCMVINVIPHQMKGVVRAEPLVNSFNFSPQDGTICVPWNENVNIGIEHNQKAEHPSIKSSKESWIYGC